MPFFLIFLTPPALRPRFQLAVLARILSYSQRHLAVDAVSKARREFGDRKSILWSLAIRVGRNMSPQGYVGVAPSQCYFFSSHSFTSYLVFYRKVLATVQDEDHIHRRIQQPRAHEAVLRCERHNFERRGRRAKMGERETQRNYKEKLRLAPSL
jgi:hypothetical protein